MPKTFYFHNTRDYLSHEIFNGFVVGRSSETNIVIDDDKISSTHLKVTIKEDKLFIEDLKTSNGTELNDEKVEPNELVEVTIGDRLQIGRVMIVLSYDEEFDFGNIKSDSPKPREFEVFQGSVDIELGKKVDFNSHEESDDPRKEIKVIQVKIKGYNRKIERMEERIKKKSELTTELDNIKSKNQELLATSPGLESIYNEHKEGWDGLNLIIKKLERELKKEQKKRVEIAPAMEKYEEFLLVSKECTEIEDHIEYISKVDHNEKINEYSKAIKNSEKEIFKYERKIELIAQEMEVQKEQEKEQIREEIKLLQEKLDNVK